jgi:N-acetylglucosamine-6-phosphate deacetylase
MNSGQRPVVVAGAVARAGEIFEGWVRVAGDRIAEVGRGTPEPGAETVEGVIAPGLFDLQVNGGGGRDVLDGAEALELVDRVQLQHGVTAYLPTVISSEPAVARAAVDAIGKRIEHGDSPAIGVHLEGPFLAPEFRGVHREECLRRPSDGVPDYYGSPSIRLVTLAPELPEVGSLIEDLSGRGIAVSIGHTGADAEQAAHAASLGARCVTHLFNGMRQFHHRSPNVPGWALVDDRVQICIVPDGHHVDDLVLELVAEKAPDRVILVTDASAAADAEDGAYTMAGIAIHKTDGTVEDERGHLAGSALTLDAGVRKWMAATDWPLETALEAASERPEPLVGLDVAIREGNVANLVVFDEQGFVQRVMWRGQWTTPES